MDTDPGRNDDPISLHRYLYVQANPISGIDPSGHAVFTLEFLFSTAQRLGIAAPYVVGAINIGNRITVVLFEVYTGESIIWGAAGVGAAGGATMLGKAALSKVEGGIGSWLKALKGSGSTFFGPKAYLSQVLRGSGKQANHLNQPGAYKIIEYEAGACIEMEGAASTKGTEHNQFHAVFENFWDLFRSGPRQGEKPTNKEVLQTLREALAAVKDSATKAQKFAKKQIDEWVEIAEKEQRGNGYHDGPGGLTPDIPGTTNANK